MPKSLFTIAVFALLFLIAPLLLHAQPVVLKRDTAKQWIGGFNAPQVQKMLLNADAIEDLVIFERTASRFFTFLAVPNAVGKMQWQYTPEYEAIFPPIQGWFLLRDYDQDGKKDFFAHAPNGIQVWRNTQTNGLPAFQPITKGLETKGLSGQINLQVAITDIPCLHDIDGDGKMDILIFDFAQGSYLEFHRNISPTPNQLLFERQGYCWGNIWEGANCGELRLDYPCEGKGSGGGEMSLPTRPTHVGSTLTVADLNHDKKLDLLIGDVSCQKLYAVYNKGTNLKPVFAKIDTLFPASKPVDMAIFPASFIEDVDFDNLPDLLVAPNTFLNEQNSIDFQHSLWLYKGAGKKVKYDFVRQDFLQQEMIEVGENAAPTFWDYDLDGDYDLIVGNRGLKVAGKFCATLHLFENIGTKKKPQFKLKDTDWLKLSTKQLTDCKPFILDSNHDGALELHITARQNKQTLWLAYQNGAWQPYPFDLELYDFPLLYDLDNDTNEDILISKSNGEWQYFKNNTQDLIEQPALNLPKGYFPIIADINADKQVDLLLLQEGKLTLYSDIQTQWQAGKTLLSDNALIYNGLTKNTTAYHIGSFASPAVADLDADGRLDIAVGLSTGGICLFWNKAFSE